MKRSLPLPNGIGNSPKTEAHTRCLHAVGMVVSRGVASKAHRHRDPGSTRLSSFGITGASNVRSLQVGTIAMAKAAKQSLIVTVSKNHNINNVARDLKAAGLEVEEKLDAVGIVTGKAHAKSVGRLRKVRGVVDVSPDHEVNIGPPDAPISW